MEVVENQQTLADFLLLAQNVEKDLASEAVVQNGEKKPLLRDQKDVKSEIEERVSDDEVALTLVEDLAQNFNEILPKTEKEKWSETVDISSSNSKPKRKSAKRKPFYEEGITFCLFILA